MFDQVTPSKVTCTVGSTSIPGVRTVPEPPPTPLGPNQPPSKYVHIVNWMFVIGTVRGVGHFTPTYPYWTVGPKLSTREARASEPSMRFAAVPAFSLGVPSVASIAALQPMMPVVPIMREILVGLLA